MSKKKGSNEDDRCINVVVKYMETGAEIEGLLCSTSRGTFFRPADPVEFLRKSKPSKRDEV